MVTSDAAEALTAVAAGGTAVLILGPEAGPVHAVPGHLAVLIGDRADPAVWKAAEEMDQELFARARG